MSSQIILITGGMRSGKSKEALKISKKFPGPKIFVATAEAFDDGMRERIKRHKEERDKDFETIEEPLYLGKAIQKISSGVVIIDCLTVWTNNLLYHFNNDEKTIQIEIESFFKAVESSSLNLIIITNEVGSGVIPVSELSRKFIDRLGRLNQEIASISDEVILMTSGISLTIKGDKNEILPR